MRRIKMRGWAGGGVMAGLLLSGSAQATVKDGVDAWQAGDFAKAIAQWQGPAEAGDADAQFDLAQAYKLGRGVPADLATAQRWYEKAANQGHEQAQANLGLILFQNGERQAALPWIRKAAERGEPRAQYVLGTALFNGDLAPKDWPRAYALMTRAAAAGLPQAASSLGEMDKYIPLGQRQQGMAIARGLAAMPNASGNAVVARPAQAASAPPAQRPVQVATATPVPRPSPPVRPATAIAASPPPPSVPPRPGPAPSAPAAPKPSAAPAVPARPAPPRAPAAPARPASGGGWRVQLGAYSTPAAARTAWSSIGGLGGAQPSFVPAGKFTRLQAGPFADKAAAERACSGAKAAGKSCFPVAP